MPSFISSFKSRHGRKIAARRRGLRVLIWLTASFWLAQIGGGLVLDHFWVKPRYPMRVSMVARLEARKKLPEILLMGSSRMYGDANEGVLDAELRRQFGDAAPRTFNASLPAADPTVYERVFADIRQRFGYRPKLLVLEVDPAALAGRDNWLNQHVLNLLDWRDVPDALPALCRNGRIMFLVNGRFLPLYVHRYHICREAMALASHSRGQEHDTSKVDPWVPPPVDKDPEPPVKTPAMFAAMEQGYPDVARDVRNYRIGGVVTRRLERLLGQCQAEGIKVVLVGIPVSSPSRRGLAPEVTARFLEYIQSLSTRYGCAFFDWRDRIPDDYFIDSHHASPEGGVYFSRRLATELLTPVWRELKEKRSSGQIAER